MINPLKFVLIDNVTVEATSNLALKGNPPNQNLQVANNVLDLSVSKMRMRLNNLFNGDAILGNKRVFHCCIKIFSFLRGQMSLFFLYCIDCTNCWNLLVL